MSGSPAVVARRPEVVRIARAADDREPLPQIARCPRLERANHLRRRPFRRGRNEEMHVVRHHLERHRRPAVPRADPADGLRHHAVKRLRQHLHPRLGNPDKVIVDVVDGVPRLPHPRYLHFRPFREAEVFRAVDVRSVLLQHPRHIPVRVRWHFFLRRPRRQEGKPRLRLTHVILAKRPRRGKITMRENEAKCFPVSRRLERRGTGR